MAEDTPQLRILRENPDEEPTYAGDPLCLADSVEAFDGWLVDKVPRAVQDELETGSGPLYLTTGEMPSIIACTKLGCLASCMLSTESGINRLHFRDFVNPKAMGLNNCIKRELSTPTSDEQPEL